MIATSVVQELNAVFSRDRQEHLADYNQLRARNNAQAAALQQIKSVGGPRGAVPSPAELGQNDAQLESRASHWAQVNDQTSQGAAQRKQVLMSMRSGLELQRQNDTRVDVMVSHSNLARQLIDLYQ